MASRPPQDDLVALVQRLQRDVSALRSRRAWDPVGLAALSAALSGQGPSASAPAPYVPQMAEVVVPPGIQAWNEYSAFPQGAVVAFHNGLYLALRDVPANVIPTIDTRWFRLLQGGTILSGAAAVTPAVVDTVTSSLAQATRTVTFNGQTLGEVALPVQPDDVATKGYVDTTVAANTAWTVTAIKNGAYDAVAGELVQCNPSGGAFAVTLPAPNAANKGKSVCVKNVTASPNLINVVCNGGTVDANANFPMTTSKQSITVVSDGVGNWMITSQHP